MSLPIGKTRLLMIIAIGLLATAAVVVALPRLSNTTPAAEAPNSLQSASVRGDLDGDGDVDQNDLNIVLAARNTQASGPNDARDLNKDSKIDALDARVMMTLCTRTRCAIERVTWSEPEMEVILSPGETATRTLSFRVDANLQNIVIEAVPEIAGFLSIQSNSLATISANQPQQVALNFAIPPNTAFGKFEGTIHVRGGSRTVPGTLKVQVQLVAPKRSATAVVDQDGGTVSLPFGGSFRISAGALTRGVRFEMNTYAKDGLVPGVPDVFPVYANLEVVPHVDSSGPPPATAAYVATITLQLKIGPLPPGSELVVLEPNLARKNWTPTGDIAKVNSDGRTVTFQTARIGLLLLVREADRELAP